MPLSDGTRRAHKNHHFIRKKTNFADVAFSSTFCYCQCGQCVCVCVFVQNLCRACDINNVIADFDARCMNFRWRMMNVPRNDDGDMRQWTIIASNEANSNNNNIELQKPQFVQHWRPVATHHDSGRIRDGCVRGKYVLGRVINIIDANKTFYINILSTSFVSHKHTHTHNFFNSILLIHGLAHNVNVLMYCICFCLVRYMSYPSAIGRSMRTATSSSSPRLLYFRCYI